MAVVIAHGIGVSIFRRDNVFAKYCKASRSRVQTSLVACKSQILAESVYLFNLTRSYSIQLTSLLIPNPYMHIVIGPKIWLPTSFA
jgi:hypothetical protein